MTTETDKARREHERLVREVQLANMRETQRLLTSAWQRKAPGIATAAMVILAGIAAAVLITAAH